MSIPAEHRLRKHAEFEVVYRCGQRHFSQVLTAFYLLRPEVEAIDGRTQGGRRRSRVASRGPRVGITVGRALGKSTIRNRIKRRVRAAVTQNLGRLTRPLDVVINPKKVVLEIEFQRLCSEVAHAFDLVEHQADVGRDRRKSAKAERLAARKP